MSINVMRRKRSILRTIVAALIALAAFVLAMRVYPLFEINDEIDRCYHGSSSRYITDPVRWAQECVGSDR